nr:hypothetical protein [Tanacetum cinerariifolium]
MAAPIIPISVEENLGDLINIKPNTGGYTRHAGAIIRSAHTGGADGSEIRVDVFEVDNASLRARIKTTEAIEKITCCQERRACMKMKRQLASVQESQRQDQENFRKL